MSENLKTYVNLFKEFVDPRERPMRMSLTLSVGIGAVVYLATRDAAAAAASTLAALGLIAAGYLGLWAWGHTPTAKYMAMASEAEALANDFSSCAHAPGPDAVWFRELVGSMHALNGESQRLGVLNMPVATTDSNREAIIESAETNEVVLRSAAYLMRTGNLVAAKRYTGEDWERVVRGRPERPASVVASADADSGANRCGDAVPHRACRDSR